MMGTPSHRLKLTLTANMSLTLHLVPCLFIRPPHWITGLMEPVRKHLSILMKLLRRIRVEVEVHRRAPHLDSDTLVAVSIGTPVLTSQVEAGRSMRTTAMSKSQGLKEPQSSSARGEVEHWSCESGFCCVSAVTECCCRAPFYLATPREMGHEQGRCPTSPKRLASVQSSFDTRVDINDTQNVHVEKLTREPRKLTDALEMLKSKGTLNGYVSDASNKEAFSSLVEDIRDVILEYQTPVPTKFLTRL
ncbi:hypothetical protein Hypma_011235 [Hypsizygus marmoreus]|uniref:Uncharacterized protein n=1 Tax=Hypsizygus marmoreus TaxID=39966 RepID=A0A369JKE5_HYPMA|nr:hypothetical protein Hypma_011235 [Hypsizygus marmoreus]